MSKNLLITLEVKSVPLPPEKKAAYEEGLRILIELIYKEMERKTEEEKNMQSSEE